MIFIQNIFVTFTIIFIIANFVMPSTVNHDNLMLNYCSGLITGYTKYTNELSDNTLFDHSSINSWETEKMRRVLENMNMKKLISTLDDLRNILSINCRDHIFKEGNTCTNDEEFIILFGNGYSTYVYQNYNLQHLEKPVTDYCTSVIKGKYVIFFKNIIHNKQIK